MINLTDRQIQILKAVIEEYIETARPVGSEILDKKYHLGVSPATIRNEMAFLVKNGFLRQPHTSAGRVPTPLALRFYIQQLMKEKELSVADEAAVKGKIWDFREKMDRFFQEVTRVLSERTKALAITTTEDGNLYHSGFANILEDPEFFDIDLTKSVLALVDDLEMVKKMTSRAMEEEMIHILLGDELGIEFLEPCSFVFANFKTNKTNGTVGVLGSCRLDYSLVIPHLRYINNLIEEIGRTW